MTFKALLTASFILLAAPAMFAVDALAPVYLDCSVGDNLFITSVEPVDSPAAIDALLVNCAAILCANPNP